MELVMTLLSRSAVTSSLLG